MNTTRAWLAVITSLACLATGCRTDPALTALEKENFYREVQKDDAEAAPDKAQAARDRAQASLKALPKRERLTRETAGGIGRTSSGEPRLEHASQQRRKVLTPTNCGRRASDTAARALGTELRETEGDAARPNRTEQRRRQWERADDPRAAFVKAGNREVQRVTLNASLTGGSTETTSPETTGWS